MYGVKAATFGVGNKIKESEACLLCKEQRMNRKPEMTLNRLISDERVRHRIGINVYIKRAL